MKISPVLSDVSYILYALTPFMDNEMTVFESEAARMKDPKDTERFESSYQALKAAGIEVRRVMCSSVDDIDTDGEAKDIVTENGMDSLPISEYQRVSISIGSYPTDQDLADFLSPPDGTLSVDSAKPPSMGNDLMPACNCGQKKR